VWLDPTHETCPYGELPGCDQDRNTLVFFQDGARFLKTPVLSTEKNRTTREIRVSIDSGGGARIRAKTTYTGDAGHWKRYWYKLFNPEERIREVKDDIFSFFPGAAVDTCTFSPVEDLCVPLTLDLEFAVPEYDKSAGDLLLVPLPRFSHKTEAVGDEERTSPLVWDATESIETDLAIQIPEGYRVHSIPEDCEVDLSFASYKHHYANSRGMIRFSALKERRIRQLEVDQYPAYREYEERIGRELAKHIVLERIKE
jgi:hypothetical protein